MELQSGNKGTTAQEQNNAAVETDIAIDGEAEGGERHQGIAEGTDDDFNVDSTRQADSKIDSEPVDGRNEGGETTRLDEVDSQDLSARLGQLDLERTSSRNSREGAGDSGGEDENPSSPTPNNRNTPPERLSSSQLGLEPRQEDNNPEEGSIFLEVPESGRKSASPSLKSASSRKTYSRADNNQSRASAAPFDGENTPRNEESRGPVDDEKNARIGDVDSELRPGSRALGNREEEEAQQEASEQDRGKEENNEEDKEEEEREGHVKEAEDEDDKETAMEDHNVGTFTVDQEPKDSARIEDEDENSPEKGTVEQETEQEKNSGYVASREATEVAKGNNDEIKSQSDKSRETTQENNVSVKQPPSSKKAGVKRDNFRRKPTVGRPSNRTGAVPHPPKLPPPGQTTQPQSFEDNSEQQQTMDSDTEAELVSHGAIRPRRRDQRDSYKSIEVKERYTVSSYTGSRLPRTLSDDDLNSSESDVMATVRDEERYEESKLRDLSNNDRRHELLDDMSDPSTLKKGRRVYFFRNGDVHCKARQILISNKTYQNFEKLLVDLSSIVETSTGVKFIFSWPDGREIKSITQFQNGKYYICSSTNRLQRVDYGNSKENPWKGGKLDRNENFLFQKDGKVQSPLRKPRVLTIISNMYRDSREKLILNTSSAMNFEEILHDVSHMVNIPNPPVRALFTERKPHQQVFSYSQLIRDFADHDNFLACGEEMVPLEMSTKRPHNGYSMSSEGSKKGSKRNARYENGYGGSPTRSSVITGYQNPTTTNSLPTPRQAKPEATVRRRKTDSVRVDINKKTREFFPPTLIDENEDGAKPDKKLRLEWVYGFRGRDVKQNLAVLPSSGELVYFVGAVVVLYDKRFSTQKHYLGHSEEITCLTVHPNGRFVATGQTAGRTPESGAHIRIWDGLSLSTYAIIGLGVFQQGIACVNFSEKEAKMLNGLETVNGDLLMAIDDSDRHVMSVWEWQTEKLVARTTTTADPVVSGCFYPFDDSIVITYGKEHVHFWRMFWDKGRKVMRDKLSGNFEDDVPKFVTSVCFSPSGDVITGDSNGTILVWSHDNNKVFSVNNYVSIQTRRAHKKSVAALCMLGDGTLFSGGGSEIKAWDSINNYSLVKERVLPESAGHVRSIVPINVGGLDGSIYVTTTRNKVLEGSLQLKFKFVIQGHVEELWALDCHPLEQTFISAGHDQTVIKWSAVSHAPVWKADIEKPCTSISIDPRGRMVALGTTAGKVLILNSYNGIQLTALLTGSNQINALRFSPDGRQLAVGTFDGTIHIFFVQEEGHSFFKAQTATLKHNNMHIMHMDWSVDSKFMQAVLGDYDIVYWDVTSMQRIKTARSLRDVKWATLSCPIGYSVIGPWQNIERGDHINVVCRSQYRDYLVAGDSRGRIRLYKYPCSMAKAGFRGTKVYSSNVTCAAFTCDDGCLITSGGNDAALMQFAVLDPNNTR